MGHRGPTLERPDAGSQPPEANPPVSDDLALVRSALARERDAVGRLARRLRCVPRILYALNRRRGEFLKSHDLEDLAQEVVVLVLQKLGTFTGVSTLESWVHGICHYQLMNRVRSVVRESERHPPLPEGPIADPEEERVVDCFAYELVEESLAGLEQAEADVVRLKHYDGLSFTQVAERLGISPNTAKSRYYRAIATLERRLAPRMRPATRKEQP